MRIMVVDDDTVDRQIVSRCLKTIGYSDILEVVTGRECFDVLIADKGFDLLLLDFYLSDFEGLDLALSLRENGVTLPIVIVTGLGDEFLRAKLRGVGVDDYIPKDKLDPQLLKVTITLAIENHHKKMNVSRKFDELQEKIKKIQEVLNKRLSEL